LEIRRATADDARTIALIHVASSQAAYREIIPDERLRAFTVERRQDVWRQTLQTRGVELWIAQETGRDLGWICVGPSRDLDPDAAPAELRAMYVDPSCWRRGVGTALWAKAESSMRAAGSASVTLWVLAANLVARSFYAKLGFIDDPGHTRTHDRGGVSLVELRMRRDLTR
jgi:GNAT superfamily N-acetyltransferase